MNSKYTIVNNTKRRRFETHIGEELAYIQYGYHNEAIVLLHTFVPESMRGQGVSTALAHFALEYIKAHNMKMIVYCPFVKKYLKRHPEYEYMRLPAKND